MSSAGRAKCFLQIIFFCSHTPPIWLAVGDFLIITNQSVPLSCRKFLTLVWSISYLKKCLELILCFNETASVITSDFLMFLLLTINLLSAIPASKYWSLGRPVDVPSNVPRTSLKHPIWHPSWRHRHLTSWGHPNLTSYSEVPGTSQINLPVRYFGRSSQYVPQRTFRGPLKNVVGSSVGSP